MKRRPLTSAATSTAAVTSLAARVKGRTLSRGSSWRVVLPAAPRRRAPWHTLRRLWRRIYTASVTCVIIVCKVAWRRLSWLRGRDTCPPPGYRRQGVLGEGSTEGPTTTAQVFIIIFVGMDAMETGVAPARDTAVAAKRRGAASSVHGRLPSWHAAARSRRRLATPTSSMYMRYAVRQTRALKAVVVWGRRATSRAVRVQRESATWPTLSSLRCGSHAQQQQERCS